MSHELSNLFRALEFLKEETQNPELQVITAQVFLSIAQRRSETPMAALEEEVGVSQAAISRNIAKLGQGISRSEPGAGWVEAYEDLDNRRRKLVRLTEKGRFVAQQLSDIIARPARQNKPSI